MEYKDLNPSFFIMETSKNNHFFIKEYQYQNTTQQFRVWDNGLIEIRFNDEFAKANRYLSREDMLSQEPDLKELMLRNTGGIPDWIMVAKNEESFIMDKFKMN
ncbi:hypothetical protein PO081_17035 [Bacteroides thetaiotaomicron]|uniref:hypothetical protein n=1 Tax=Bacteroides thetaiotaomicron TaxID=818 RepID=UPI00206E54A3|nr:hypothetical protein [Bacteroides thetaiotaomicron]MDC2194988.1 hypothetical protein [Bacteroides thetaiotaomicron]DAJ35872.1 MAG TPA: hypothetical protein [Caudoviricetes sp.]